MSRLFFGTIPPRGVIADPVPEFLNLESGLGGTGVRVAASWAMSFCDFVLVEIS